MVKDTFVVKADLFPLGGTYNGQREERHFEVDAEIERYILAKLDSLRRAPHLHHVSETDDRAGLAKALWRVFRAYADEWPSILAMIEPDVVDIHLLGIRVDGRTDRTAPLVERRADLTPLGAAVAGHLKGEAGIVRLADALGLCCQEDLVVMRGLPGGAMSPSGCTSVSRAAGTRRRRSAGRSKTSISRLPTAPAWWPRGRTW